MAQRSWDQTSGQLDYINSQMKDKPERYKKLLREYLCNLAFEIHQSRNLYITLRELVDLPSTQTFTKKCFHESLLESPEKIKEINKYLLISFYFQETKTENHGDTAIEFFHNSLFEYLTAEYFWKENRLFLLARDEDGDLKTVQYEEYFELLNRLVGNKEINGPIQKNLEEIIKNDSETDMNLVVSQSKKIFYDLVENDILLRYNRKECKLTSKEKTQQLFNLFWTFLHTANINIDERFVLPAYIGSYLSNKFSLFEEFKNMKMIDQDFFEPFFIHEGIFDNLIFENGGLKIDIVESEIVNTQFINISIWESTFRKNVFDNVIFTKCDFENGRNHFFNNEFNNCIFHDVQVDSEEWYNTFTSDNNIDPVTLRNHSVEERMEKDYKNEDIKNYYIVFQAE